MATGSAYAECMTMPRIAASALAALLVTAWTPRVQAQAEGAIREITIRASAVLPDRVQDAIDAVAEPTAGMLPAREDPAVFLRRFCGSVSNSYLERFALANRAILASPRAPQARQAEVLLPACAQVQRNVEVRRMPGETIGDLMQRSLGVGPEAPLSICPPEPGSRCRLVPAVQQFTLLNGPGRAEIAALDANPIVTMPFVSTATTLRLRSGIEVDTAIRRLREAAAAEGNEALLRVWPAQEFTLLGPLTPEDSRLQGNGCAAADTLPGNWPFDAHSVRQALRDAVAFRRPREPTTIRIVDTGIAEPHRSAFRSALLHRNDEEGRLPLRPSQDRDNNGFSGDVFGTTEARDGDLAPPPLGPTFADGWHGAEVAHMALGGAAFWRDTTELDSLIRLTFTRIFTTRPNEPVRVNEGALALSLIGWPQRGDRAPQVVNMSIGGPRPSPTLSDSLATHTTNRLLVVAAGNEGQNLRFSPRYPAALTGNPDVAHAIIVVGAHGPRFDRLSFSNYGRGRAHLLAPGCRITRSADPGGPEMAGTSFAAPLVSFTAAALISLNPNRWSPRRIRDRLRLTVRYVSQDIEDQTIFGGVLDIPAALRVYDDVVRLRDGSLVVGRWVAPEAVRLCQGQALAFDPAQIGLVRVVTAEVGEPTQLSIHLRDPRNGGFAEDAPDRCSADIDGIDMQTADGGRPITFLWRDMAAFIPAVDPSERRGEAPLPQAPALAIRDVQQALRARGVAPDLIIDDRSGPATTAAIRSFQRQAGEAPTGSLTRAQLRALALPILP